ncbi:hypothetical protein [Colwellia hornerae]|uniref:RHS repeat-associated core domain-containing protein n=1 Tax=Colwellia hornerae TaxID=89402 RepID=A0A5C6Q288_9GAMM|nr:hypothetical protein [Colwellia hornerae]TWX44985.1 hypothetical protein ESZ28_18845 [Colwellia hornerae]TWX53172.1 hypothetical protein ESZ26_18920 [Colwellia hornerae]TWX62221.1 hypothetical protein ESZ27_18940 [Colwellia hornerae]
MHFARRLRFTNVHTFNRYAYANNNPYKYVDPDGQLAIHWHGGITFVAALNSGHSLSDSLSIGYRAMQADWEEGSQGSTESACARHAMECPNSNPQAAKLNHAKLITGALNSGDLGLASHAIQDQFAGGHRGFSFWPGSFGNLGFWGSAKHLLADIFPSFSTISSSYSATKTAISGNKNSKPSGGSKPGAGNRRGGSLCGTLKCKEDNQERNKFR